MKYTVKIEVEITGEATEQDVKEFIQSELGYGDGLNLDNPFIDQYADALLTILDIEIE